MQDNLRGRLIQTPISHDSNPGPGNVKQGSSGHSPPWQWSVAGKQYLIQWEHSENETRKPEKGQKSQKPKSRIGVNFSPRPISSRANSWFEVYANQFSIPRRMRGGVEGQCGRAFLSLPRLLGVPDWRLHWEHKQEKRLLWEPLGPLIFLWGRSAQWSPNSLFVLSPDVNLF